MKPLISRSSTLITVGLLTAISISSVYAQKQKEEYEFIASVNGIPITKGLLDLNIQQAISQGQRDTPQLRKNITDELINRTLLSEEAIRLGLENSVDLQDHITQLKQNLLINALIENYLREHPINDARLKDEYDKYKELVGDKSAYQYQYSQILVLKESDAIAVINRLNNGEDFAKVAQQVSLDNATKNQGGRVGWINQAQLMQTLNQPVSQTLVNLEVGSYSKKPTPFQGVWAIIKKDDQKSTKLIPFDQAKQQIRQSIIQQYLIDTLKTLKSSVIITR